MFEKVLPRLNMSVHVLPSRVKVRARFVKLHVWAEAFTVRQFGTTESCFEIITWKRFLNGPNSSLLWFDEKRHKEFGSAIVGHEHYQTRPNITEHFRTLLSRCRSDVKHYRLETFKTVPGSDKTSLAAAISMNFFSAIFFSFSSWKLSGCHSRANFLYAFMMSFFCAFLQHTHTPLTHCYTRTPFNTLRRTALLIVGPARHAQIASRRMYMLVTSWHSSNKQHWITATHNFIFLEWFTNRHKVNAVCLYLFSNKKKHQVQIKHWVFFHTYFYENRIIPIC